MQNQMSPVRSKLGLLQHKYTCSGDGGEVHVLRFQSRAWEHVPIPSRRRGCAPIRVEHAGSVPTRRVGSVVSDLLSQVGSSGGMWAEWVRSAFHVAWPTGPSKIGPRWASSLDSEVGYEHCPYAELWLLTGALRITEYPQNELDPCRRETRFRVRRCPFV
ncbi:hypothetical protein PIB30_004088 [Stylosanthes scabra]|uniref:Uncharacterized protein n=1 Tax=Stylosanthes scabra TaxID=79078 RepID=A0ABU6Z0A6_9FABA|nr:hypothetical protein [Stylosanthes scabra]